MTPTLYVFRVGDGSAALSSAAAAAFLEHRDLSGALLGTVNLPVTVNGAQRRLTVAGTSTSEGSLNLSPDGKWLTFAGYDADPGTATVATTLNGTTGTVTNRVVGRLDATGALDTSTVLDVAFTGNGTTGTGSVRSATTSDGQTIWVSGTSSPAGTGGVYGVTFGSTTGATQVLATPNTMRWLGVFGTQLYGSSAAANLTNVFTIGSGLPTTTGQTATALAGMPTTAASPYGFVLLDLNASVAGLDTLYVADDSSTANNGGIQKWTSDGTTWTRVTIFTPPNSAGTGTTGARGLAVVLNGTTPTLVAVTSDAGKLVSVVDDGTASPTFTVLASPGTNQYFRGVAVAPH